MIAHYKTKKKCEKYIHKHDILMNRNDRDDEYSLWDLGYTIFKTNDVINNFNNDIIRFKKPTFIHNKFGNYISREIDDEILRSILSSKKLSDIVIDYLGEGARLDDIYIWSKVTGNSFDISEGWHTDDVGHRLKLFICIEADEDSSTTLYCPQTNKISYRIRFKHIVRYLSVIAHPYKKFIEYKHQGGNSILFDTNGEHRGNYTNKNGNRLLLVLEFINRDKSNLISGMCPCGPGQSPNGEIFFHSNLKSLLDQNPLIDKSILKYDTSKNEYLYSIKNLYSFQY